MNELIDVPAGLKGVAVATTSIGSVRGEDGFYHYRQYDAAELARRHRLEEVWQLVLDGSLPGVDDGRFAAEVAGARVAAAVDPSLIDAVATRTDRHHHGLLALLPLVATSGQPTLDQSPAERRDDAVRVAAAVPTLLAAAHRRRQGLPIVDPDATQGHAADWIAMATGVTPSEAAIRLVETYLVATIDHGFNASTFATRVVTSTGADVVGAFSAGIAALAGPLHGGAPARALDMIEAIGDPANTEAWVRSRLESGAKIMGFGHAVYRADDPRSVLLKQRAMEVGGELVERAVEIERRTLEVLRAWRPSNPIVTNVEFYAGVALHLAGLPAELFTPTFTVSRAIGWSAHVVEQAGDNKILRPSARYVGPQPKGLATV